MIPLSNMNDNAAQKMSVLTLNKYTIYKLQAIAQ